ncbi:hypothetical protein [Nostoc sp. TCL240-02]|uniref:hypothetical protein n=1 Tax=Nostoc sp. TCL240-02 TaxID=2572090 RepID=UPI00157F7FA3|nr:hypothetical protein [Nostoc sp. TCL240-02]QKQ73067.1 hypothetical protein FBB35_06445 [Nostoc sp. TCL240-02]
MLSSQKQSNFINITTVTITLIAIGYYLVVTEWNVVELLRFCIGIIFLWMPLGALFYILLKRQVQEPIVRLTFSAIASYTLTTLIYFSLAVMKLELLFYIGGIAISIALIIYSIRKKKWLNIQIDLLIWQQFDWVLALLIAVSLVVNIPYQIPWKYNPITNTYKSTVCFDCHYFTSEAYELARHVPPLQQPSRAGTPEVAYHMFPHLTTMLLSRFTGQTDMQRVQIVYHYIIIEIGMCLALYSIVKTLTNSRVAGYLATATMYVTAIPYSPFVKNDIGLFYFTLFPHVSSGIEVLSIFTPQMYSGMLVAYGILLGILHISVRCYKKQPVDVVLIITTIMVISTSRFRIHVFLSMLPGFVFLAVYGWKRTKQKAYLIAASLAIILGLLICLEMKSSYYLAGSASIKLGFNNLTNPKEWTNWINAWPFSQNIYHLVSHLIPNSTVFKWVWQIVSMSAFVALNMIGIPLIIITSIYLSSKSVRQEFFLFTSLIVWMIVVSTLSAICLTSDYDSYSLAGQMMFPPRWYLFLLMIPGFHYIYQFFQPHLSLTRPIQISLVVAFVVISLAVQQLARPSLLMTKMYSEGATINASERMTFAYLHDNTPKNSVILTDKYVDDSNFLLTSITGRAAYLEKTYDVISELTLKAYPLDNREQVIKNLWATSQSEQFCQLLMATPATHVIEYSTHPLLVNNPLCIQSIWESSNQSIPASFEKVTIWKINR